MSYKANSSLPSIAFRQDTQVIADCYPSGCHFHEIDERYPPALGVQHDDQQDLANSNHHAYPEFVQEEPQQLIIWFTGCIPPLGSKNIWNHHHQIQSPNNFCESFEGFSNLPEYAFKITDSPDENLISELKAIFRKYGYEVTNTSLSSNAEGATFVEPSLHGMDSSKQSSNYLPETTNSDQAAEKITMGVELKKEDSIDVSTTTTTAKGVKSIISKNSWVKEVLANEISASKQIDRLTVQSAMMAEKDSCRLKLVLSGNKYVKTIYSTKRDYPSQFTKNKKFANDKGFEAQLVEKLNNKFKLFKGFNSSNKKRDLLKYLQSSRTFSEIHTMIRNGSPEEKLVDKCLEFVESDEFQSSVTVSNAIGDELAHLILILARVYEGEASGEFCLGSRSDFKEKLQKAVVYANLPQLLYLYSKEEPIELRLNENNCDDSLNRNLEGFELKQKGTKSDINILRSNS